MLNGEASVRKRGGLSYPTVTRVDVKSVCMAKPSLCKRIGMSILIRAKGQLDVVHQCCLSLNFDYLITMVTSSV